MRKQLITIGATMENITGQRIQKLRKQLKMSGTELGEKIGYTKTAISYWETGRVKVNDHALIKLAKFFNVTTDYLLGLDDSPRRIEYNEYHKAVLDEELVLLYEKGTNYNELEIELIKNFVRFIKTNSSN